eukprot:9166767-Ditylum_brightwellii.AAC.1
MTKEQETTTSAPNKEHTSDLEENLLDPKEDQMILPAPAGKVAKFLASIPIAKQKDLARKFYKFLTQTNSNLSKLNADNHALTAL